VNLSKSQIYKPSLSFFSANWCFWTVSFNEPIHISNSPINICNHAKMSCICKSFKSTARFPIRFIY